ncbi:imidazolonepropionase-like amidohydrolase [Leucobacter exalbidus]|uniref:Imidazolonepropionase-like amidohydrolase n=1 Tax=Leucobacter exalbidus TaxID=662960 RepID=A0A940PU52_9MICO|nr:amidohydrolase family protein [Leucobacter exalbidus]MBP1326982.1 imidazolonepropionase-like amidohydrolase [Leucobacter exalbidus]
MNHDRSYIAVRNVRVWRDDATFSAPTRVSWTEGLFDPLASGDDAHAHAHDHGPDLDGTGLWLIPGLVDAHLHAGWQAFNAADRDALDADATHALVAAGLRRTLQAGFTSARDAGGLTPEAIAQIPTYERPRMQAAIAMIDRGVADRAGGIERAVDEVLSQGAQWVKLVATAGVASPAGAGLEAHFTRTEVQRAVSLAGAASAQVMVHAWGGAAIDDAIEAGAASIEHGIFLTPAQATRITERGVTFVPTLRIYRLVQAMIERGELPASFAARVAEAVSTHPHAVRIARDAGCQIALGTDYGTPGQHGTGRLEFDVLVAAGLTPEAALVAATRGGAQLLAGADPDQSLALAGRIAPGAPADAVLLRRDPRQPGALSDPAAIAAVIAHGRLVADVSYERNPS